MQSRMSTQFNCQKYQVIQLIQTVLIQAIQFSISLAFVYTQLSVKTITFQTIQFNVSTVSMSKLFHFKQFDLAYKNNSVSNNSI